MDEVSAAVGHVREDCPAWCVSHEDSSRYIDAHSLERIVVHVGHHLQVGNYSARLSRTVWVSQDGGFHGSTEVALTVDDRQLLVPLGDVGILMRLLGLVRH